YYDLASVCGQSLCVCVCVGGGVCGWRWVGVCRVEQPLLLCDDPLWGREHSGHALGKHPQRHQWRRPDLLHQIHTGSLTHTHTHTTTPTHPLIHTSALCFPQCPSERPWRRSSEP